MDEQVIIENQTEIAEKTKIELPPDYKILLHNDDVTTVDFVINLLISVFKKDAEDAIKITKEAEKRGSAVIGIYTYDIAATLLEIAEKRIKEAGFPLLITMEQ